MRSSCAAAGVTDVDDAGVTGFFCWWQEASRADVHDAWRGAALERKPVELILSCDKRKKILPVVCSSRAHLGWGRRGACCGIAWRCWRCCCRRDVTALGLRGRGVLALSVWGLRVFRSIRVFLCRLCLMWRMDLPEKVLPGVWMLVVWNTLNMRSPCSLMFQVLGGVSSKRGTFALLGKRQRAPECRCKRARNW